MSTSTFQEEESKFECLLQKKNGNKCGGRFTRDQLFRHMQSQKLHKNPQKAPKGQKFRGWFKSEDKDYAVSAVFKSGNESNPDTDEEIELDVESLEKSLAETREQIKSKKLPGTNVKSGEDEDSNEAKMRQKFRGWFKSEDKETNGTNVKSGEDAGATSSALENSKEHAGDISHPDRRLDDKVDDDLRAEEPMIQPAADAANNLAQDYTVVPVHGPHAFLNEAQETPNNNFNAQDQFEVIGNVSVPDTNSPQQKSLDDNPTEGSNILVPEGSSVTKDGSIIAPDGLILAPAGTVIIGEDGTLMMSENSALLSDNNTAAEAAAGGGAAGTVFTTPDGNTFKAGEGDILTNEGNILMDEDGTILTMVHLGALGATTSTGVSLISTAPTPASRCVHQIFLVANNKYSVFV